MYKHVQVFFLIHIRWSWIEPADNGTRFLVIPADSPDKATYYCWLYCYSILGCFWWLEYTTAVCRGRNSLLTQHASPTFFVLLKGQSYVNFAKEAWNKNLSYSRQSIVQINICVVLSRSSQLGSLWDTLAACKTPWLLVRHFGSLWGTQAATCPPGKLPSSLQAVI